MKHPILIVTKTYKAETIIVHVSVGKLEFQATWPKSGIGMWKDRHQARQMVTYQGPVSFTATPAALNDPSAPPREDQQPLKPRVEP